MLKASFAADARTLHHAVELLRSSPRALVRADAAFDLGKLEVAAGRRDAAITALDRAWEIFDRLGAHSEARNVAQMLQDAAVRRRRTPTAVRPLEGWPALTATEERVARLIAEGHTNRSAAAALVLSPNTIATHLRSIAPWTAAMRASARCCGLPFHRAETKAATRRPVTDLHDSRPRFKTSSAMSHRPPNRLGKTIVTFAIDM